MTTKQKLSKPNQGRSCSNISSTTFVLLYACKVNIPRCV